MPMFNIANQTLCVRKKTAPWNVTAQTDLTITMCVCVCVCVRMCVRACVRVNLKLPAWVCEHRIHRADCWEVGDQLTLPGADTVPS